MKNSRIVSIIGAGPAGLSASIQLSRFGIEHYIFEKSVPGGLLRNGNRISNYTGVFPSVTGEVLAEMMREHFNYFAGKVINLCVNRIIYDNEEKKFITSAGETDHYSDFVIAASGTRPVIPEILKTVHERLLKYIEFEVTEMNHVENGKILVVGGGDSGFDYALTLSASNKVEIINRSERIRAIKSLQEIVLSRESINYHSKTELTEITDGEKKPLKVSLNKSDQSTFHEFDRIVFAIGRDPEDSYLSGLKNEELDMLIGKGRIYMAGDIRKGRCRQALIAAGNGLESAMKINEMIEGFRDESSI